jgi:histidinol-phosphate phosphatase family protein
MISINLKIDNSWTLFLDRDGVINKRIVGNYVKRRKDFEFLPGVLEAIARFSSIFGHIFVVTNQQGIGKQEMTERNLLDIHAYMLQEIEKAGGKIHQIYFAPELESSNNTMRKPNTGMGLQAKNDFPVIDFSKSIMVGDADSDIHFGTNLGMKTVKIGEKSVHADYYFNSLIEFAKQLI